MRTFLVLGLALLLGGCRDYSRPDYQRGDFVEIIITSQKGQVVGFRCPDIGTPWRVTVRHATNVSEFNDGNIFGGHARAAVNSYQTTHFFEYEIRPWEDKE